jgi:hypothetical protein
MGTYGLSWWILPPDDGHIFHSKKTVSLQTAIPQSRAGIYEELK